MRSDTLGIAITSDGSFVYVTNFGANSISVINTNTNTVVDRISIGSNPIGIAIANITESKVDLTITKMDFPDPVKLGDFITYTIPIKNNGPCTASGVTLFDKLPEGVDFISAISTQGTCSASSSGITCHIGTLEKGKTVTVTINVKSKSTGTFCNEAVVSANEVDSDVTNNTAVQCTTVLDSAWIETKRIVDACAFQKIKQKTFMLPCIFSNQDLQCEIIKNKCRVFNITRINEQQVNVKIRIKVFLKIKNRRLSNHVRVVYFDQTITLTSPEGTDICCEITDAACECIQTNNTNEETFYNRFFNKISCTIQVNGIVKSTKVTQLEVALLRDCELRPCQCPAGWLKADDAYEIQLEACSNVKSITVEWEDKNTGGSGILDLNGMLYGPPIDISDTLNTYTWDDINTLVCSGKIHILSGCAHITNVTVEKWIPVAPGASYPLPSEPSEISKITFEAKTDSGTISVMTATGYGHNVDSVTVTEFQEQFELNLSDVYPIQFVELINKGISTVYISNVTTE